MLQGVCDVMVGGSLGHSDHEMMGFLILREARSGGQQNCCLGLLGGRLQLFRRLVDRVLWEAVLRVLRLSRQVRALRAKESR